LLKKLIIVFKGFRHFHFEKIGTAKYRGNLIFQKEKQE